MPTEKSIIDAINKAKSQGSDRADSFSDTTEEPSLKKEKTLIKGSDSAETETEKLVKDTAIAASSLEIESDGRLTLSKKMLQHIVDGRADKITSDIQQQLREIRENNQALLDQIQREKDARETEREELQKKLNEQIEKNNTTLEILAEFGPSIDSYRSNDSGAAPIKGSPFISTQASNILRGDDAYREFKRIHEDANKSGVWVTNQATGKVNLQIDTRNLTEFVKEHRQSLRDGMECFAKKNGMIRGGMRGSDAPTTLADVPPLFLDYLSQVIRMEHTPRHILWQFSNRKIQTGIPPGQTILVPRIPHIVGGTIASDWTLTPGTSTNTGNQPLLATAEAVTILENGMGGLNNLPVAIPEFITAHSLADLESALRQRIGFNYAQWEDLAHQELWFSTTNVVYNNGGGISPTAAGVTSGGQLTVPFLGQLYSYLSGLNIPTYPDGCYGYACPPSHVGQLQADTYAHHQYMSKENVSEVTSMLLMSTQNNEINRISGYIGKISGFHIFQGSSFSTGIVGTPGVASESTGGGARIMRSGFAFGPDSIGWATSMPMMLRRDNNDDFGRLNRYIWVSHEGYGALDIDPNRAGGTGNEQLRVIEVRMADSPT